MSKMSCVEKGYDTNAFVRTKQNANVKWHWVASKHLVTLKERPTFGKTLWHSHFGDERPDFAERLPEDPRVLLPIDVEVVGEAWKRQKGREGGNLVTRDGANSWFWEFPNICILALNGRYRGYRILWLWACDTFVGMFHQFPTLCFELEQIWDNIYNIIVY